MASTEDITVWAAYTRETRPRPTPLLKVFTRGKQRGGQSNQVCTSLTSEASPLLGFVLALVSSSSKLTASVVRRPDFESDASL